MVAAVTEAERKAGKGSRETISIRRQAREAVVKALFAVDIGRMNPERALRYVLEETELPAGAEAFAGQLVTGVVGRLERLDAIIDRYAVGWRTERMPAVDRNILRLALYEILYRDDIPASASVNEAVEIAKRYGDDESPKFINGVLGEVIRREAGGVSPQEPSGAGPRADTQTDVRADTQPTTPANP